MGFEAVSVWQESGYVMARETGPARSWPIMRVFSNIGTTQ